jgi:hypothetical protein
VLQTRCDELQSQMTEMKRKKWEDKFATQSTLQSTSNGNTTVVGGMTRSITLGDGLMAPGKKTARDESDSEDENGPENGILKEKIKVNLTLRSSLSKSRGEPLSLSATGRVFFKKIKNQKNQNLNNHVRPKGKFKKKSKIFWNFFWN